MRTRIKICGITRPEDAVVAANLGTDAIGLVFYRKSPRAVTIGMASGIVRTLPPFVTVVGLFVNADRDFVDNVLQSLPIDVLQFHGDESAVQCEVFSRPYIKAIPMREGLDLSAVSRQYAGAQALLVDTYQKGVPGGTGKTFDWSMIPSNLGKPIILAGGLKPGNASAAVRMVHPYAVDVSGGVESDKGIKDAVKIAEFIHEVNSAGTG
ncbi:MAG: phosphoribosylanthranilate isomerase [Gammaproteobacteria bacterium]|nr:phosphoribosylanthranilate isomerase [Gammaproteobacteria bacterium]